MAEPTVMSPRELLHLQQASSEETQRSNSGLVGNSISMSYNPHPYRPKLFQTQHLTCHSAMQPPPDSFEPLFAPSTTAKIWATAMKGLLKAVPPTEFPEYTEPGEEHYVCSRSDFWTSGFFPGCLYLLYERVLRWPHRAVTQPHILKLQHACGWWSEALHSQATRNDTHDLGFMIQPWAQRGWELDGSQRCRASLVTAAYALASRFDKRLGAIRSWDTCTTKRYHFDNPCRDFLVIIDSMMNLDILFYAAAMTGDSSLAHVASTHAATLLDSHFRDDHSTFHVVNFEQQTGEIKQRMTNQGYTDDSCWARGQAWAIAGYAQTYGWTRDSRFLYASQSAADFFLENLPEDGVPQWDFNAPRSGPKDTSAALIAAYGMLLLHIKLAESTDRYLTGAFRIVSAVISTALGPTASFIVQNDGHETVETNGPETVVLHATINNYEYAPRRWADHGLVYADYYFLLIGNTLLEMGLA